MEQTLILFIFMLGILGLILAVVAYMLSNSKKTYVFPPFTNECPDFYYKNQMGHCLDIHNLFHPADEQCYSESFQKSIYTKPGKGKESGLCNKLKWANNCNVSWDGITNNDGLCI